MNSYAYCEDLVRTADKDRFLASLFAPAELRRHLFALYAFNVEIARVREVVRTPMAGEIRLQWWRGALQGEGYGEVRANPVADALIDTMASYRLPVDPLLALIEARSFDLYDDPMPSLDALYGYARKTSSNLIELAAIVLGGGPGRGRARWTGGNRLRHCAVAAGFSHPRHPRPTFCRLMCSRAAGGSGARGGGLREGAPRGRYRRRPCPGRATSQLCAPV